MLVSTETSCTSGAWHRCQKGQEMRLHYGVLRGRPDRAKREDGVRSPRLQIRTMDASGQPWRVAVNMKSGDGSEGVFWIVDPLVGQPFLGSLAANPSASLNSVGTSRPTASQDRTAVSSEQAAGDEPIRPTNRDSEYSPARTKG